MVVVVGASRERAVVKVGESSGLSGAVERIMAVFKSKSPPAAGVRNIFSVTGVSKA